MDLQRWDRAKELVGNTFELTVLIQKRCRKERGIIAQIALSPRIDTVELTHAQSGLDKEVW